MPKRVYTSWLIAALFGGVIIGIACAALPGLSLFASSSWLFIAAGLVFFVYRKPYVSAVVLSIIAGIIIGLWRGSHEQIGLHEYKQFIGKQVTVSGVVAEDVSYGANNALRIKLRQVALNHHPLNGQIWLSSNKKVDVRRSDTVVVKGLLREGFGNFSATISRAQIVTVERVDYSDVARDVRDDFARAVRVAIAEPQASLGVGFLTGQRSTLPADLDEQLKIVGLTHVVVASGYNLTILVRFARRAFAKISKYLATFAAGSMITGFVLVTGWSPSMSRAGLVAGLSLLAWYYGRVIHPVVLLSIAAGATALINPLFVWGDIGWYLSFAAFAGVIMLAPLVHDFFWGAEQKPGVFRQIFIDTSCAQIATMPIMAFAFGSYSIYALPANLLVLALVPLAMLLTFFAGIAGLVAPAIASIVGWPAQMLLQYMTHVVGWIAARPGAEGTVTLSVSMMIVLYVLLLLVGYVLARRTNHSFRKDSLIE